MGQDPPDGRDFYQVTARSTGGSGQAEVVLQSTYTRKF
jgi:Tfp pilus assembly protein PilX